jgi:hypothetical protein
MAVDRNVRATGSRAVGGVGVHSFHMNNPADEFTDRVLAFREDIHGGTLEDNFENWPKEKIREAVEGMQREDQKQQNKLITKQNADAFIASHPEFLDIPANAALMKHELNRMFGDGPYSVANYETAEESLRASNFLRLNKKVLAEQQTAAALERAKAEKQRNTPLTQEQLYEMPLEDLRRLDAVEAQQRMQRRGEEGGW